MWKKVLNLDELGYATVLVFFNIRFYNVLLFIMKFNLDVVHFVLNLKNWIFCLCLVSIGSTDKNSYVILFYIFVVICKQKIAFQNMILLSYRLSPISVWFIHCNTSYTETDVPVNGGISTQTKIHQASYFILVNLLPYKIW